MTLVQVLVLLEANNGAAEENTQRHPTQTKIKSHLRPLHVSLDGCGFKVYSLVLGVRRLDLSRGHQHESGRSGVWCPARRESRAVFVQPPTPPSPFLHLLLPSTFFYPPPSPFVTFLLRHLLSFPHLLSSSVLVVVSIFYFQCYLFLSSFISTFSFLSFSTSFHPPPTFIFHPLPFSSTIVWFFFNLSPINPSSSPSSLCLSSSQVPPIITSSPSSFLVSSLLPPPVINLNSSISLVLPLSFFFFVLSSPSDTYVLLTFPFSSLNRRPHLHFLVIIFSPTSFILLPSFFLFIFIILLVIRWGSASFHRLSFLRLLPSISSASYFSVLLCCFILVSSSLVFFILPVCFSFHYIFIFFTAIFIPVSFA